MHRLGNDATLRAMKTNDREHPLIWAHRGASGYEIDNTFESFDLAFEQGADGIESDVRESRDGYLFLYHDDTIMYEGRSVRPEELTLEELQEIDLGGRRRIPSLERTLRRYRDTTTAQGNPQLFSLDVIPSEVGIKVAELVVHLKMSSRVVITPSDTEPRFFSTVRRIRTVDPDATIVRTSGRSFPERLVRLLPGRPVGFDWEQMRSAGIRGINLRAREATDTVIHRIRRHGLQVYVWDCHDDDTMRVNARRSVDALYTNYPDRLRAILA